MLLHATNSDANIGVLLFHIPQQSLASNLSEE